VHQQHLQRAKKARITPTITTPPAVNNLSTAHEEIAQKLKTAGRQMGRNNEISERLVNDILSQHPYHLEALRLRCQLCDDKGEWVKAFDTVNLCIRIVPLNYDFYFRRAALFIQKHRHLEALADLKQGFSWTANNPVTQEFTLLLLCHQSFHRVRETALFYLEQSLRLHPNFYSDLLVLRGIFYSSQNHHQAAIKDFEEASKNGPHPLATTLKNLVSDRRQRISTVRNPKALPCLQSGRVPVAVLLNENG
jgi:tetratricopeptide (TPR) repeat protein